MSDLERDDVDLVCVLGVRSLKVKVCVCVCIVKEYNHS